MIFFVRERFRQIDAASIETQSEITGIEQVITRSSRIIDVF
jgi:hypothetical protein